MVEFIVFIVLFVGGIFVLGIAHGIAGFEAVLFVAGILLVSAALAFAMRQRGSATRRSKSWSQDA